MIAFNSASVWASLNVAVAAPLNVFTSSTAAATSAAVPLISIAFVTVIVPLVSPSIVVISVALISTVYASDNVTFPVYAAANVPANAALTSAVEPDSATA